MHFHRYDLYDGVWKVVKHSLVTRPIHIKEDEDPEYYRRLQKRYNKCLTVTNSVVHELTAARKVVDALLAQPDLLKQIDCLVYEGDIGDLKEALEQYKERNLGVGVTDNDAPEDKRMV